MSLLVCWMALLLAIGMALIVWAEHSATLGWMSFGSFCLGIVYCMAVLSDMRSERDKQGAA